MVNVTEKPTTGPGSISSPEQKFIADLPRVAVQKGHKQIIKLLMKNSLQEENAAKDYEMCLLELSKQAVSS